MRTLALFIAGFVAGTVVVNACGKKTEPVVSQTTSVVESSKPVLESVSSISLKEEKQLEDMIKKAEKETQEKAPSVDGGVVELTTPASVPVIGTNPSVPPVK